MRRRRGRRILSVLLACSFMCAALGSARAAQKKSQAGEAQPREGFGSSLKRKKNDPRPQAATEPSARTVEEGTQQDETIRVETLLTVLDVTVTDAKESRFINGLGKDDFVVVEDGVRQRVDALVLGDDTSKLPRSIVLIIDWSGSQRPYIEESFEAARQLVNQLAPADEMAIVTDDVHLACDFTRDKKELKKRLDNLRKLALKGWRGQSRQFSALLATLRELITDERKRPVIIFQTDGDEVARLGGLSEARQNSRPEGFDLSDIFTEAERSRAKIYTVIPGERLLGVSDGERAARLERLAEKQQRATEKTGDMWFGYKRLPPLPSKQPSGGPPLKIQDALLKSLRERVGALFVRGQEAAAHVAELTGGWTSFLERPEQAREIYGRILADINHQYIISYYPTNKTRDGKLRRVRVEVRGHPEYVVRGRQSYYATSQ